MALNKTHAGLQLKFLVFCAVGGLVGCKGAASISRTDALNAQVLQVIASYYNPESIAVAQGDERLKRMGTIADCFVDGALVARGLKTKAYCTGMMLEVFIRAHGKAQNREWPELGLVKAKRWGAFRKKFYGLESNPATLCDAIVEAGLGRRIVLFSETRPGDFVQFWRNNGTGHTAVLLGAYADSENMPVGLRFWSIHDSGGLCDKFESVGSGDAEIDKDKIYVVRAIRKP